MAIEHLRARSLPKFGRGVLLRLGARRLLLVAQPFWSGKFIRVRTFEEGVIELEPSQEVDVEYPDEIARLDRALRGWRRR